MTNQPEIFDDSAKARIAHTVQTVERWAKPSLGNQSPFRPSPLGFWAVIPTNGSDGVKNLYSWIALAPQSSGSWQADSTKGSGLYNSSDPKNIPAACIDGCVDIPYGVPVWLEPAQQQQLYVFNSPCGVQPATIKTFNAGSKGTAYVGINSSAGQVVNYLDISSGSVQPGTNCLLSYCSGTPGSTGGQWVLVSIGCAT